MALAGFLNKLSAGIAQAAGSDPQYTAKSFATMEEMGVDRNRPFNKNCFVLAHNAQASRAYGFVYFQQELSIPELLDRGVRGLNIDVRVEGDQVYLVHGTFNETKAQMAGGTPPLASTAFQQVAQWLQAHPTDVVLVLLESYVPNKDYLPPILQASGLEPLIFYADGRNGGWNVEEKGWPTINQMVEMGKRCVVLSGAKEDGMPYEYWYAAENNFGDKSLKPETWAESRWETAPIAGGNFLFICNRFPDMDTTPLEGMHHNGAKRNDSTAVFEMVNDITTKIAAKGVNARYPNFIAADMINHGTNGGLGEAVRRINTELWSKV